MTPLALSRRGITIQWVRSQLIYPNYQFIKPELGMPRHSSEWLTKLRLYMIGKQVMVEDLDSDGLHILDNDDNWAIFEREMQLPSSVFYDRADMSLWSFFVSDSMPLADGYKGIENQFYRIAILDDGARYGLEIVTQFPTFESISDVDLHRAFGAIGGKPRFRSEARLNRLGFNFDGFATSPVNQFNRNRYEYTMSLRVAIYDSIVFTYEPVDREAVVVADEIVVALGTNTYNVRVTAHDGVTIKNYQVTLSFV